MKVVLAPLQAVAPSDSLTMREWEALARAMVDIEHLVAMSGPAPMTNGARAEIIRELVINVIRGSDLLIEDWFINIEPYLEPRKSIPVVFDTWTVTLRLAKERSSARFKMLADPAYAPTLAEQFGKAKR